MLQNVSLEIMEFVERNILPKYNAFDKAHSVAHASRVIASSLKLARAMGADLNMAYVIAAYHDLGLQGPRAVHHITGGKILLADKRLEKWFSPHQRNIMKEAIEDHRASASHAPRSLYGRIVAEADRDLEPLTVLQRTVEFGIAHYPDLDKDQQFARIRQHLNEKYGVNGYIKLWIRGSLNERYLAELRGIISSEDTLRREFNKIWRGIYNG